MNGAKIPSIEEKASTTAQEKASTPAPPVKASPPVKNSLKGWQVNHIHVKANPLAPLRKYSLDPWLD